MNPLVEATPEILFDRNREPIANPNRLLVGYSFYLSQKQHLASGEPVKNPFEVGPDLLDIPEIQNSGLPDVDLLLVTIKDIPDDHLAICQVEAEIEDSDEILQKLRSRGSTISRHDYKIHNRSNPFSQEDIRSSLNHLVKNIK